MANVAEGFSRKSDKEFGQFLFIAKSSAAELQSHAYVAFDQGYISESDFKQLYDNLDHTSRMISNLIKHLTGHSGQPTR
jgi:four helix bundle protein